jgi:hypothetical protein
VVYDHGFNVMGCPTSAMRWAWKTQSWESSSVLRARDDGGHAYAIYHARVFSTLTGGEPLRRDKRSTWRLWSRLGRAF